MKSLRKVAFVVVVAFVSSMGLTACSAEVGSKEWCESMKKKNKGDWSANEAADFAKHCVF